MLPLACMIAYLVLPKGRGSVWLVSQRFPSLFLLTLVPMLRLPRVGMRAWIVTAAALAVGLGSIVNVCKHFVRFQLEEVGDIDEAIEQIPPGKKVAALIYDKGFVASSNWAPFLHFGSYYQAERGARSSSPTPGTSTGRSTSRTARTLPARPGAWSRAATLGVDAGAGLGAGRADARYDYVLSGAAGSTRLRARSTRSWRGDRWSVWKHD